MSDGPRVTVIVPAFNAEATLRATMASVTGQSHRNLEIFIVDDGSTDGTAALADEIAAEDPRITVIRQVNGGVARARNTALARATGEYVAWIDADDLWRPEKIARQLGVFAASAEPLAFVYTGYRLIDEADVILANRRPLVDVSGWTVCQQIATNFFSNVSSIMVPRELAQELGGHDPVLRDEGIEGAEDLLLQLRLALRGPAGCLRSAPVGYRMHSANMSRGHARAARSNLRALEIVEAEAKGSVPDWVFRMGRARVVGYAAHCRGSARRGRRRGWWPISCAASRRRRRRWRRGWPGWRRGRRWRAWARPIRASGCGFPRPIRTARPGGGTCC